MTWIELIIHTTTQGADDVSALLMELGSSGTMTEDRADIPDPSKPHGIWEIIDPAMLDKMPEDVLVHSWFPADDQFPWLKSQLESRLDALRGDQPRMGTLRIEVKTVPDENWAETWKESFHVLRAGQHLLICPSWEKAEPLDGDHIIEMDPGMAFGSGSHDTTLLCLALLEKAIHGGERVIDIGTGSGILAIGAALSGASRVLAIDIDPDAVRVARDNIERNGVSDRVTVQQGNLLDRVGETCDICVANIIADVIRDLAAPLKSHIRSGGEFICSGIILSREEEVREVLLEAGYEILEVLRTEEWTAFRSRRPA